MKSITLITFIAVFLVAFNYPKTNKFSRPAGVKASVANDTTKIDYWKQRARLAENEAKQQRMIAEKMAAEAQQHKMMAEKNAMDAAMQAKHCRETEEAVDKLTKQLQDCEKK